MNTYLELEPNEKELSGLVLMFGKKTLKNGVTADDIKRLLDEAEKQDPLVALRVNTDVDERNSMCNSGTSALCTETCASAQVSVYCTQKIFATFLKNFEFQFGT